MKENNAKNQIVRRKSYQVSLTKKGGGIEIQKNKMLNIPDTPTSGEKYNKTDETTHDEI